MGRYTKICNLDHRKNKNISSFLVFAFHLIIQHDENFPGPVLKIVTCPLNFLDPPLLLVLKAKKSAYSVPQGKYSREVHLL